MPSPPQSPPPLTELLRAYLKLLEVPLRERVYRPRPPLLWRAPEALARIRALLPSLPAGASLDELLPPTPATEGAALWRRSALASTLLAGLELCRDGTAKLDQDAAFGGIRARPDLVESRGVPARAAI